MQKNYFVENKTCSKKFIFYCLFFIFVAITTVGAQVNISVPNLKFTQICTDEAYNVLKPFKLEFNFSPVSAVNPTNQFIVELSDGNGLFTNPSVLYTSVAGAVAASPVEVSFGIPTSTAGENYKIRIRSTSPASTSPESAVFSAYYQIQNSTFSINNFVANINYCKGGGYELKIDPVGIGTNDSPLKYPSLTYKWYKEAIPFDLEVATTTSFNVTQPGTYFVKTNYGSCSSSSYSNRVVVSEILGATASITSSKGNPFCASQGTTTLRTDAGSSYQWFLNGVLVPGATAQTYEAAAQGMYSCIVNFGSCSTTPTLDLKEINFVSTLNVSGTLTLDQGQTKKVILTTTADAPIYKWYLNTNLIVGATQNTYDVSDFGTYKVTVSQGTGCAATQEFNFIVKESIISDGTVLKIPNLISPNGDGINDTWVLPQEYTSGTNTQIEVISSSGKPIFKTNNYQNNWPEEPIDFKNSNPVFYYIITTQAGKVNKGSITVIK